MNRIVFSQHALDQITRRGATPSEVEVTLQEGEPVPAKKGRRGYRKNFPYSSVWKGTFYETKQVLAIVVDEGDALIVITVYVFYFGAP